MFFIYKPQYRSAAFSIGICFDCVIPTIKHVDPSVAIQFLAWIFSYQNFNINLDFNDCIYSISWYHLNLESWYYYFWVNAKYLDAKTWTVAVTLAVWLKKVLILSRLYVTFLWKHWNYIIIIISSISRELFTSHSICLKPLAKN